MSEKLKATSIKAEDGTDSKLSIESSEKFLPLPRVICRCGVQPQAFYKRSKNSVFSKMLERLFYKP